MSMTSTTTPGSAGSAAGNAEDPKGAQAVKEHAGAAAATARDEATGVVRSATEHARSFVGSAGDELRVQSRNQVARLSEFLDQAAQDLGRMAEQSGDSSPAGRMVRSMADASGQLARRMDQGGPEGMVEDLSRFARRRPGVFLMASAAAGFAVGRLARSTDTQAVTQAVRETGSDHDGPGSPGSSISTASSMDPSEMPPVAAAEPVTSSPFAHSQQFAATPPIVDPSAAGADAAAPPTNGVDR